jgi:MoxR-like ATPase
MEGRDYVIPEDVQAVLPGVALHRLQLAPGGAGTVDLASDLLKAVKLA